MVWSASLGTTGTCQRIRTLQPTMSQPWHATPALERVRRSGRSQPWPSLASTRAVPARDWPNTLALNVLRPRQSTPLAKSGAQCDLRWVSGTSGQTRSQQSTPLAKSGTQCLQKTSARLQLYLVEQTDPFSKAKHRWPSSVSGVACEHSGASSRSGSNMGPVR